METNDINIKILCQNIANNPKDFDASTLEIWFNRFAKQEFRKNIIDSGIVNGQNSSDKVALNLLDVSNNEVAICIKPNDFHCNFKNKAQCKFKDECSSKIDC